MPYATIACPALSLASTSGQPLERVDIGALPPSLEPPLAGRVTWDGGDQSDFAYVQQGDDGTATLLVPMHPTGSVDGGDVVIRFTDGTSACPPVGFHIDALPAAPGEFASAVDLLQQIVDLQAHVLGSSADELRQADPTTLPERLLPMLVMQSVIDHPDNPNSLRALADGTSELTVDRDLLDRLIARVGLRPALEDVLANAEGAAAGNFPAPSGALFPAGADTMARAAGPPRRSALSSPEAASLQECLDVIATALDLSNCMSLSNSAAFGMDHASGKVLNDLSHAVDVASVVPAGPVQAAAKASALAIFIVQTYQQALANLLPSEFVGMHVDATPVSVLQDEDANGGWSATVSATSKGWKLDTTILQVLSQFTGGEVRWISDYVPAGVLTDLAGLIQNKVIGAIIGTTKGSDFVQIAPQLWTGVDVTSHTWSVASIFGEAFDQTSHTTYEPIHTGTSDLHVGTKEDAGQFGYRHIETDPDVTLTVEPVHIRFVRDGASVSQIHVGPDETVHLTVVVEQALHPELLSLESPGSLSGTALLGYSGDATYAFTYTAPSDLSTLPENVSVIDDAHTGSLAVSGEVPRQVLSILPGDVEIQPRGACVEPDGETDFGAVVTGLDDPTVEWNASLGTIDGNGHFAAAGVPSGTDVQITAASVEDPSIADTVYVHVGDCSCRFGLTSAGGINTEQQGPAGYFDYGGTLMIQMDGHQDLTGVWTTTASLTVKDWMGALGTYTLSGASLDDPASSAPPALYQPEGGYQGSGSVTVTEIDADEIKGTFSAQMSAGDGEGPPTSMSGYFSASRGSGAFVPGTFGTPFTLCQIDWTP